MQAIKIISIHAPREGSDKTANAANADFDISIHAPREGSDRRQTSIFPKTAYFYPRSPRGERHLALVVEAAVGDFYPRSPRGGRRLRPAGADTAGYFYPRSPRGERLAAPISVIHDVAISIHAPREGSDRNALGNALDPAISIHAPREGSDPPDAVFVRALDISIHAPREGSDTVRRPPSSRTDNFYPRSPRGERLPMLSQLNAKNTFLSTLPARGATRPGFAPGAGLLVISIHAPREGSDCETVPANPKSEISIHAPREGSDGEMRTTPITSTYFYPRSPRGERHHLSQVGDYIQPISIHAPREGSDRRRPG